MSLRFFQFLEKIPFTNIILKVNIMFVKRVNGSYIRKFFTNKIMVIEYFVVVSIHGFHT